MKITRIETLQADAGWRPASFVKVSTDEGLIGWSEYSDQAGNLGVSGVIAALGQLMTGRDPREVELAAAFLKGRTMQSAGGVNQHAIAAITNALLDIKGKALGVPVHALLGGAVRDRAEVYWSHCGSYRARHAKLLGVDEPRSYDDFAAIGREVRERGFRAAKTSIMTYRDGRFGTFAPGFAHTAGYPGLNLDRETLTAMHRQLEAMRDGMGADLDLMLDVNFNFRADGFTRLAREAAPYDLAWIEIDTYDAPALARIREKSPAPIASCEALFGRTNLRRFLEEGAVDVVIIDIAWNGYLESLKMAALAEAYELNVATHNYGGGVLGDVMSAHFAAAIPNFRISEYDIDDVPWKKDFLTGPLVVENGEVIVPQGPGWGLDVNEEALRAHPPRR